MKNPRLTTLIGMVALAAMSRLIPHPYNFTPVAGMALFGGAKFDDKRMAFLVPLLALLLSDTVLGFYKGMPVVYLSFALIVCIGIYLKSRCSARNVLLAAFSGSILFYVVTNFFVWAGGGLYPMTPAGLAACYITAIPFFGRTIAGDLVYSGVLFGGLAWVENVYPMLRQAGIPASI